MRRPALHSREEAARRGGWTERKSQGPRGGGSGVRRGQASSLKKESYRILSSRDLVYLKRSRSNSRKVQLLKKKKKKDKQIDEAMKKAKQRHL